MNIFLPYARHTIDESDRQAVSEVLLSSTLTRGPHVEQFENELAAYVQAPFAVCFSSGSTALEAAFQAASLSEEDRVVSTPNTFIATVAPAKRKGASLELVDIDEKGNIDLQKALSAVHAKRTRGRTFFVPVHFAGHPVNMPDFFEQIAKECYRLFVFRWKPRRLLPLFRYGRILFPSGKKHHHSRGGRCYLPLVGALYQIKKVERQRTRKRECALRTTFFFVL